MVVPVDKSSRRQKMRHLADFIIIPFEYHIYLSLVLGQSGLSKYCRPRSDAAECSILSESTLFATYLAVFRCIN